MFVIPNVPEIKRRRKEIGLSQHRLSLQSDLSGCAISRIESGRTKRINHLWTREIAKVLDCKVEEIFTDAKGA
ncbi:MAG: helix-turn-helix transcriptional regulator [Acutalibacter sp.]|nr:helix-turn-helix transcriptional regulator [Acutalibacter sp.]